MTSPRMISPTLNGEPLKGEALPRMLFVDFLRDVLGKTGTHVGCEHGVCGACTVIVDGMATRSCLMFAVQAEGAKILTVEGLAEGETLHPLQKLFSEHRALQCGFCTPGMMMTAIDLVENNQSLTEDEIKIGMSATLCRCTGYEGIIRAVISYAELVYEKPITGKVNDG